jgi:hypothetical protein
MDTAKKAGKVAGAVAKGAGEGVKMAGKAAKVGYKMATEEKVDENRFASHDGKDSDAGSAYAKPSKGGNKKGVYTLKGKDGKPLFDRKEEVEVDEAVYGGTPKKKEEPKDTRMIVTPADKKGNTPAYQNYKKGDKRYKASPHLGESNDPAFDKVRAAIIKKHGAASLHGTPENKAAAEKRKKEAEARKAKMKPTPDTRSDAEKMADAYASPRKGPGGAVRAD